MLRMRLRMLPSVDGSSRVHNPVPGNYVRHTGFNPDPDIRVLIAMQ